jgi:uncharacterized protein
MRLLVIPLLIFPLIASVGEARTDCNQSAITQTDLNICSRSKLKETDDELNRVYQAIRKKYVSLKGSSLAFCCEYNSRQYARFDPMFLLKT